MDFSGEYTIPSTKQKVWDALNNPEKLKLAIPGAENVEKKDENIKNVSKSLPIGYKLIVKEHPNMKYRGWRSIGEMKQIMSIPNVEFVHPSTNNLDLIKKSAA